MSSQAEVMIGEDIRVGIVATDASDVLDPSVDITIESVDVYVDGTLDESIVYTDEASGTARRDVVVDSTGLTDGQSVELRIGVEIDSTAYDVVSLWHVRAAERGTDSANTQTPLDAAGVRSAVGLAAANVDTQFAGIATDTDRIPAVPATESTAAAAQTAAEKVAAAYDGDGTLTSAANDEIAESARVLVEREGGPLANVTDAFDGDGTLTEAAIAEITTQLGGDLAAAIAAQLQLAAVRRAGDSGPVTTDRIVYRGTTWSIGIPFDLPEGWTRIEFTARDPGDDDQADSLVHIVVSDPSGDDGLKIFGGSSDVDDASKGSIAVDGSPVVSLAADVAAEAPHGTYAWDCKVWVGDSVERAAGGTFYVERDVTRSPLQVAA